MSVIKFQAQGKRVLPVGMWLVNGNTCVQSDDMEKIFPEIEQRI